MPSATSPHADTEQRFEAATLRKFAQHLLERASIPTEQAAAIADILLEAELLDHKSHGLQLLPAYLASLANGNMKADSTLRVVNDNGVVQLWDGNKLPGQWLVLNALKVGCERANRFGMSAISIRHSHHIGALATYLRRTTDQGLMSILVSSAPARSCVAPFGGTRGLLSTNPIAVGIPTSDDPILIDLSTSITTNTMAALLAKRGARFPAQWLLDEAGQATNDPAEVTPPKSGTLLPLGGLEAGHKGFGLGLIVEVLTAALAGSGRMDDQTEWSATVLVIVIDPQAFAGEDVFRRQADWIVEQCRTNPPVDPDRPVRLPGERAQARRRDQLENGVLLSADTLSALRPWAERMAVDMPAGSKNQQSRSNQK